MAAEHGSVLVAIVTVSDTRTPETDKNAAYLREQLAADGNEVVGYRIIKDERIRSRAVLDEFAAGDARMILFNGGTGIAPRDTTFDVLNQALEKILPGFGELFRMFSYDQVGAAAMLSRATAGVYRGKSNYFNTRLNGCGTIGMGKTDWTGVTASGMGGRTIGKQNRLVN